MSQYHWGTTTHGYDICCYKCASDISKQTYIFKIPLVNQIQKIERWCLKCATLEAPKIPDIATELASICLFRLKNNLK